MADLIEKLTAEVRDLRAALDQSRALTEEWRKLANRASRSASPAGPGPCPECGADGERTICDPCCKTDRHGPPSASPVPGEGREPGEDALRALADGWDARALARAWDDKAETLMACAAALRAALAKTTKKETDHE